MIESTETETKETVDSFAGVMLKINEKIEKTPDIILEAPRQIANRYDVLREKGQERN